MFRHNSSDSVLPVILALVVIGLPFTVRAQCPGPCGDLTGDSLATSADVIALMNWVQQAIPPPLAPECGDVDSYEGLTVRDPIMWLNCIKKASAMSCQDLQFNCTDPPFGPYVPSPSSDYRIVHNDIFPAGDSVVMLKLDLRAHDLLYGLTAPLGVSVAGETPAFANLVTDLESFWFYKVGRYDVPGAPAGHLLLGYDAFVPPDSGFYRLAEVEMHLPVAAFDRTITLEWLNIAPDSTHMVVDKSFLGWEMTLAPCHVTRAGDVNTDDQITAADIIWLINHVFTGGPEPLPCAAAGDADCSGALTAADAVRLVNYVFRSGEPPCRVCALVADGVWTCP